MRQGERGRCPVRGGQLDTDEDEQRGVEQVTGHLPEGDDLDPGVGTDDARAEPSGHKAAGDDGEDAGHVQRFGGQVGEERGGDTQHAVEQGLGRPAPDGDQEQCDRGTDHDSAGVGLDESERRTGPGEGSLVGDDLDGHGQQDIGDSANPAKAGVSPTRQPAPSSGSGSLRPVRHDGGPVASTPTSTTTISSGLPTSVPFVFMAPRSRPYARVTRPRLSQKLRSGESRTRPLEDSAWMSLARWWPEWVGARRRAMSAASSPRRPPTWARRSRRM